MQIRAHSNILSTYVRTYVKGVSLIEFTHTKQKKTDLLNGIFKIFISTHTAYKQPK